MSVSRTVLGLATSSVRAAGVVPRAAAAGWVGKMGVDRSFSSSSRCGEVNAESSTSSFASASTPPARTQSSSSSKSSISRQDSLTGLPPVLPRPHGIQVAQIKLYSHTAEPLERFSHFALHTAHSLNIPASRPASLPMTRSLYTVPKSPFVHKKAQENFESRKYTKVIVLYDAHPRVVDMYLRYLTQNSIAGVGMKVKTHEFLELGVGKGEVLKQVEGLKRDLGEDVKVDKGESGEGVDAQKKE
ncbi:ribosomal protein S10 [Filobasidium floriforme]|uniref:ribosomal protein S10 n=1 Tax=Filobasidium floriforme TaxID=5210 RepID=UPI001E8EED66|nr:ribosomal protein S10 [Filobasidium floriforme]KAH8088204.1 ribosomal protein S10 [Filobasidium floriforme]